MQRESKMNKSFMWICVHITLCTDSILFVVGGRSEIQESWEGTSALQILFQEFQQICLWPGQGEIAVEIGPFDDILVKRTEGSNHMQVAQSGLTLDESNIIATHAQGILTSMGS